MAKACLYLLLLSTLFASAVCQESCPGYYYTWKCKWYGKKCTEWRCHGGGTFTCTCPGNAQPVSYNIACQKTGGCTAVSAPKNCNKFTNCAVCRGGTSEWDDGGCLSCKAGFQLVSYGCTTDIDECSNRTWNQCEQLCTNTYGSYMCSCRPGYKLRTDRYTCERLPCEIPGEIADGTVTLVGADYLFESYITYSCKTPFLLVGNAVRQCVADSVGVYWDGTAPECVDPCTPRNSSTKRSCGPAKVPPDQCRQLGCCYDETGECYFTDEHPYAVYQGEQPFFSTEQTTFHEYTATGCSITCQDSPSCKSFAIQRTADDVVAHQVCYLDERSREELVASGNITVGDLSYDLHQPLELSGAKSENVKLESLYVGCFEDDSTGVQAFKYQVLTSDINTPDRCISTCRQQGFAVVALKNGDACYCDVDSSLSYRDGTSQTCNLPCTGNSNLPCGSATSSSVYRVPPDSRYIGCFADRIDDPDFLFTVWSTSDGHTASDCIDECLRRGFKYAAVQNGSQCYCGNTFGRHGDEHYDKCNVACSVKFRDSCGGPTSNAVYATEKADTLTSEDWYDQNVRHLHTDNTRLVQVPFRLFTELPHLKSITTPRFILHVTDSVVTPNEDRNCHSDCYKACGDISPYDTQGLEYKGRDQIARFFFLNLANLQKYVGRDAERVFVYAQTVLIDTDLIFPFSLQVHTRQLIVDRNSARIIRVNASSPTLDIDEKQPRTYGVEIDSMFQKQSFMCARILWDTRNQVNVNTAWAILFDLAQNQVTTSVETSAWVTSVRMFNAHLSGVDRQNVHFVPFYSKSYFSQVLKLYYERLTLYKNDFDRLLDSTTSMTDYVRNVEEMTSIYTTTSVADAKTSFDAAKVAISQSSSTYSRLQKDYNIAAQKVVQTGDQFESNHSQKRSIFSAIFGFVKFIGKMIANQKQKAAKAKAEREAKELERQLNAELNLQLNELAFSLSNTAEAFEFLSRFMDVAKVVTTELAEDGTTYDFTRYTDDIETAGQMKADAVHWRNLKNNAHTILSHPNVYKMKGCGEYMRAVLDMCDWGEALSNSAIEHSELLRDAINKRYLLLNKMHQSERYQNHIDQLKSELVTRQQTTAVMAEQLQDVRIDVNNVLFSLCQAYFYENLKECKPEIKPSFGGSLSKLLLKINAALMDSLLISSAPSTVSRRILIADSQQGSDCVVANECPIQTFKETGVMTFKLPVSQSGLTDLSSYRVSEILLEFVGARRNLTVANENMKVRIESSGVFYGKDRSSVYNFVTRPLSLTYEYGVETNYISIRADVYAPYRSTVQHITPYTTWIIRQSEYSRDIDLTSLSAVRMTFQGSASNQEERRLLQELDMLSERSELEMDVENNLKQVHSYDELMQLEYTENKDKFGDVVGVEDGISLLSNSEVEEERYANSDGHYYNS